MTAVQSLTFFVILLAAEGVHFDDHLKPQFTAHQISATSAATRDGLELWAATERGRNEIRRFDTSEYEIIVLEDRIDSASGEAPQPGIATLLGANDRAKLKSYELILNPEFRPAVEATRMSSGEPTTPAQAMAAAWAAEMLHIDFYSRGISLPHHSRADFQEEWREVASQLGFPYLAHGDESDNRRGPNVIFWRGRR
jgi:hypothetical protein